MALLNKRAHDFNTDRVIGAAFPWDAACGRIAFVSSMARRRRTMLPSSLPPPK